MVAVAEAAEAVVPLAAKAAAEAATEAAEAAVAEGNDSDGRAIAPAPRRAGQTS